MAQSVTISKTTRKQHSPEVKSVFIEKHQAEFSIKAMCRVLSVARSDWYAWLNRRLRLNPRKLFRQQCDTDIGQAFHQAKQRYGAVVFNGVERDYNRWWRRSACGGLSLEQF